MSSQAGIVTSTSKRRADGMLYEVTAFEEHNVAESSTHTCSSWYDLMRRTKASHAAGEDSSARRQSTSLEHDYFNRRQFPTEVAVHSRPTRRPVSVPVQSLPLSETDGQADSWEYTQQPTSPDMVDTSALGAEAQESSRRGTWALQATNQRMKETQPIVQAVLDRWFQGSRRETSKLVAECTRAVSSDCSSEPVLLLIACLMAKASAADFVSTPRRDIAARLYRSLDKSDQQLPLARMVLPKLTTGFGTSVTNAVTAAEALLDRRLKSSQVRWRFSRALRELRVLLQELAQPGEGRKEREAVGQELVRVWVTAARRLIAREVFTPLNNARQGTSLEKQGEQVLSASASALTHLLFLSACWGASSSTSALTKAMTKSGLQPQEPFKNGSIESSTVQGFRKNSSCSRSMTEQIIDRLCSRGAYNTAASILLQWESPSIHCYEQVLSVLRGRAAPSTDARRDAPRTPPHGDICDLQGRLWQEALKSVQSLDLENRRAALIRLYSARMRNHGRHGNLLLVQRDLGEMGRLGLAARSDASNEPDPLASLLLLSDAGQVAVVQCFARARKWMEATDAMTDIVEARRLAGTFPPSFGSAMLNTLLAERAALARNKDEAANKTMRSADTLNSVLAEHDRLTGQPWNLVPDLVTRNILLGCVVRLHGSSGTSSMDVAAVLERYHLSGLVNSAQGKLRRHDRSALRAIAQILYDHDDQEGARIAIARLKEGQKPSKYTRHTPSQRRRAQSTPTGSSGDAAATDKRHSRQSEISIDLGLEASP